MIDIEDLDMKRLDDIKKKSNGDEATAMALSRQQANLIKDPNKSFRRYLASTIVYGMDNKIGRPFLLRAAELGQIEAKKITQLEYEVRTGEKAKKELERVTSLIEEKFNGYRGARDFGFF